MFEDLDDLNPPALGPQHREAIAAHATRLRQRSRRQRLAVGSAAAVVAVLGLGVALAGGGTDDLVVASDAALTTTTSTSIEVTTTVLPATTAPEATAPSPTPPSMTTPPVTEPPPPPVTCSQQGLTPRPSVESGDNALAQVRIELDRTVVGPGEGLTISAVAFNPTDEEIELQWVWPESLIRDASGQVVWHSNHQRYGAEIDATSYSPLPPGGAMARDLPWSSVACAGTGDEPPAYRAAELAPGTYTVELTWLGQSLAPVTFEVQ